MQRPEGSWLSLQIGGEKRLYTPVGTCQKQMRKESPTQQRICVFFFSPQFQPREYFWSYRNVGSFEYVLGLAVSFGSCCMVCFSPRATIHSEILSVFREVSLHVCFESTLISQRHPLQLNQFSDTPKSWELISYYSVKLGSICFTNCHNYFGEGRQGTGIGQFGIGISWGSKYGGRTAW